MFSCLRGPWTRKGLSCPPVADAALVVVRTFLNRFEAELARAALEGAGIDSMIRSDDCGGTRPHMWVGGIELLVRSEDAEYAAELVEPQVIPDDETD